MLRTCNVTIINLSLVRHINLPFISFRFDDINLMIAR